MSDAPTTRQRVISYSKAGKRPPEIAALIGCSIETVYHYRMKARQDGCPLPRQRRIPQGGVHTFVMLNAETAKALRPQAEVRDLTVKELATALLIVIARDDLATSILDDEDHTDV